MQNKTPAKLISLNARGFTHLFAMMFVMVGVAVVGTYLLVFSHAATKTIDVSYPQGSSMGSIGYNRSGIVGVNGGGDFIGNRYLKSEVKHFSTYSLYVNTNYPSSNCPPPSTIQSAKACGRKAGFWDFSYAHNRGASASIWWIDVEEGPGITWSSNKTLNRNFLYGIASALQAKGVSTVGYYSTGSQWNDITGGWHNGNYAWYATGYTTSPSAARISSAVNGYCKNSFTGGRVLYAQYIELNNNGSLDIDVPC